MKISAGCAENLCNALKMIEWSQFTLYKTQQLLCKLVLYDFLKVKLSRN